MVNTIDRRGRNLVTRGSPHFFKVVFFPIHHGIKIPTVFMRKYGDNLKKMVWLKAPAGVAWPVQLLHTDNGTWLDKGWQEFAEYYSIEKFHFLVFRYDGNSQFHVVIFDKTASEIEYPFGFAPHSIHDGEGHLPPRTSPMPKLEEIYSDDESIEILEEISAPCKSNKYWGKRPENPHRVDKDIGYVHGLPLKQRIKEESCEGTSMMPPTQFSKAGDRTKLSKRTSVAYQEAKAFESKSPFFIAFMQPSYVSGSFTLNIPLTFARNYLTAINYHYDFELRLSKGEKRWPMRCTFNSRNGKIYRGWKEFVLENSLVVGDVCVFELVVGDVCVFELVRGAKIFNIFIYRRS